MVETVFAVIVIKENFNVNQRDKMSAPEELFALHLRAAKIPCPAREYRFHSVRKFRFDFAWIEIKLAAEIDGAVYTNGRHNRGKGYESDCFKMALALSEGWAVYRFTSGMVANGSAISFIEKHFQDSINKRKQVEAEYPTIKIEIVRDA